MIPGIETGSTVCKTSTLTPALSPQIHPIPLPSHSRIEPYFSSDYGEEGNEDYIFLHIPM